MSILDAVLKVLTEEKRPMSAEELTKHIVGKNLWIPETKTPVASVGAALYSDPPASSQCNTRCVALCRRCFLA